MKSLKTRVALVVMSLPALTAAAPRNNDSFAHRRMLPSTASVDVEIARTGTLGYEPLDPIAPQPGHDYFGPDVVNSGSLWFEWIAPQDGIFRVSSSHPDGRVLQTFAFEGPDLAHLVMVRNGNHDGMAMDSSTSFVARTGGRYQIAVRDLRTKTGALTRGVRLIIRPSANEPANTSLATRHVLTGSLPITVTTTNFAAPTQEANLFEAMTRLSSGYLWYPAWGPALWWEWTCPADGIYDLRADGPPQVLFTAKRQAAAQSTPGIWESREVPEVNHLLEASAGEVFDIAVATLADSGYLRQFGELTVTLAPSQVQRPANLTAAAALALPASVPATHHFTWPGGLLAADVAGMPRLHYRFTAPADGIYAAEVSGAFWNFFSDAKLINSSREYRFLRAGEVLPLEVEILMWDESDFHLTVDALPPAAVSDSVSGAIDCGDSSEFRLTGHQGQATVEPGETFPAGFAATGSLWWRWTAPGDGWLKWPGNFDMWSPVEIFENGAPALTGAFVSSDGARVTAGRSYLLRAFFTTSPEYDVCDMTLRFIAMPENLTWQTATDLGTAALAAWSGNMSPGAYLTTPRWFRWTAAEALHASMQWNVSLESVQIFTDPAAGVLLPIDPLSNSWQFTAGQTYWMSFASSSTGASFEMVRTPPTAHGNLTAALELTPELPAGGTISLRGDINSAAEVAALETLIDPQQLVPGGLPVVWFRWKAPSTQTVHVSTYELSGYGPSLLPVFSGEAPGALVREALVLDPGSETTGFLQARSGVTYWIAYVGGNGEAGAQRTARLELRPVLESAPENDSFANRTVIDPEAWRTWTAHFGRHRRHENRHPLRYESSIATLESGEPPVALIIGAEGNAVPQTASTWWKWTAPASGIYGLALNPPSDAVGRSPRSGPDIPAEIMDLTADIYTGDSLAALRPVPVFEHLTGQYLFRAAAGTAYSVRIASAAQREEYVLQSIVPNMLDCFDFRAVENLLFEDVGAGLESYAGDAIPNYAKLFFGMDYYLRADHPDNVAAARDRIPRQFLSPGWLEMRCRPDRNFAPAGSLANLRYSGQFHGFASKDLINWEIVYPEETPEGELSLRIPSGNASRSFLQWDPLAPKD